ncbi:ABC transporter permease [Aestuariimicrobium soli]|uniref:ABC transporter permease n=1 Tax=Aestuariimicrobium soli TaxID=2035834 RepID=UPI003EB860CD
MLRYLLSRVLTMLLVLFVISIALFGLSHAAPGGPLAMLIPPDQLGDSQALIEAKTKEYGLDKPLVVQYLNWIGRMLTGDMGQSFQFDRPVGTLLLERIPPTMELMLLGFVLGNLLAILLGMGQAARKGTLVDYGFGAATLLVLSTPAFFIGMLLIYFFSAKLQWLPSSQMSNAGDGSVPDLLRHLVLPVVTLAMLGCASMARYVRAGMLEELQRDYVRTAIAKGASQAQARWKAFRNALGPLVTIMMMSAPALLSGAVVLEAVFAWPGMGTLTIRAIQNRDYPVILGFGMVVAIVVVVSNLLADIFLSLLDPRVVLR